MAAYRLYHIDGAGRFSTAEWIEAESDDAAIEAARTTCRPLGCELWQANRLVGRISGGEVEKTPDA